jgi:type VI secretion system secreted protein VgrG
MATAYRQADRMMTSTTPLAPDKLLLVGVSGTESISQLFRFQFMFIATNDTDIPFDQILGKKMVAHINSPQGKQRHIAGICSRLAQGARDPVFTSYRAEIVPEVWFLTRKAESRIFQAKTVPQILESVFKGLQVTTQLKGTYEPRDYCVQYRETDFNFASRLMEEEGIFYFFKHTEAGHSMVVADTLESHSEVPFGALATFAPLEGTEVEELRVTDWEKAQDLRSLKFTLWDHCFELPHKHLEAEKLITDSAQVGTVPHKLKLGNPGRLEIFDWPGEYAQRFDGVGPTREDRASDIQKIFKDNQRTVQIRMEQEAALCLSIAGAGHLRQFTAGHRFTLKKHFNADGDYILTSVHHNARMIGDYRSDDEEGFIYSNTFTCQPASVPFRPQRVTPRPVVPGSQTAVVVGPKGEEVFTDKYGRVKVQFHWDREGKNDEKSSCWIRVAQLASGKRWGTSFWPRIGQEVVVDYLEGDPDQPIIVGIVYNADQMPPYLGKGPDSKHPDENLLTGYKSNTSKGGEGFNELRFFDAKDKQQIFIHAERNMDARVKKDSMESVQENRHLIVGTQKDKDKTGDQLEQIHRDKHLHVHRHQQEHIEGNMHLTVGKGSAQDGGNVDIVIEKVKKELIEQDNHVHVKGNRTEQVGSSQALTVGGNLTEKIGGKHQLQVVVDRTEKVGNNQSLTVGMNQYEKVGMNHAVEAGMEIHLKSGMKLILEAGVQLTLKGPGGFVDIGPAGVTIQGLMVLINSGGAAGSGSGSSPETPQDPATPQDAQVATPTDPTEADDAKTGQKSAPA